MGTQHRIRHADTAEIHQTFWLGSDWTDDSKCHQPASCGHRAPLILSPSHAFSRAGFFPELYLFQRNLHHFGPAIRLSHWSAETHPFPDASVIFWFQSNSSSKRTRTGGHWWRMTEHWKKMCFRPPKELADQNLSGRISLFLIYCDQSRGTRNRWCRTPGI